MTDFNIGGALIGSLVIGYIISAQPDLSQFAMQAFALAGLGFFVLKRVKRAKLWHIMPEENSLEIVLVSFAVFVLIANTGNLSSPFFPIGFLHLFFLALTTSPKVSVATTTFLVYLHYLLTPTITPLDVASLATLPLLLFCFLFAKAQYDEVALEKNIIAQQEKNLQKMTEHEHTLESFISFLVLPKIETIQQLLEKSAAEKQAVDAQVLKTQITILASESEKVMRATQSQKIADGDETT